MKRSRRLSLFLCIALLVGCNSVRPISSQQPFIGIVGKDVKTVRPVLLWRLSEPWRFESNIAFHLYERDSGNSWRKEGWLPIGTTVTILEVNRYLTNEAGLWVGVVGTVNSPTEGLVKFIYVWPSHRYALDRAAWEGDETPPNRPLEALH
jgi:hypothetical protein